MEVKSDKYAHKPTAIIVVIVLNILAALAMVILVFTHADQSVVIHHSASGEKTLGSPLILLVVPALAMFLTVVSYALYREEKLRGISVPVAVLIMFVQSLVAMSLLVQ